MAPPVQVTAVCANARPFKEALVPRLMAVPAKTVPTNDDEAPVVSVVPICQKTFFAKAPPERTMEVDDAVDTDVAAWKIHTSVELPVRVKIPAVIR